MEAAIYSKMINHAKYCLPSQSFLEPHDIVIDAYLKVGSEDTYLLRKTITSLAYSERGQTWAFAPLYDSPLKNRSVIETSRVCKYCGIEKGFDSFQRRQIKFSIRYETVCKTCIEKRRMEKIYADPIRHEAYKKRRTLTQRARCQKRKEAGQLSNWQIYALRRNLAKSKAVVVLINLAQSWQEVRARVKNCHAQPVKRTSDKLLNSPVN